jgi:hypothetical protein
MHCYRQANHILWLIFMWWGQIGQPINKLKLFLKYICCYLENIFHDMIKHSHTTAYNEWLQNSNHIYGLPSITIPLPLSNNLINCNENSIQRPVC